MSKSGHAAREQQSMPREIRDSRFRQGDTRRDSEFFTGWATLKEQAIGEAGRGAPLCVAAIGNKQTRPEANKGNQS